MTARLLSTFFLSCLAGCVSYERDDATASSIAAEVELRTGGTYSVDDAILLALRQNPELRALEARARAAGAATTVPLPTTGEFRGRNEAVGIMLDPIALLGLGPRGAAIDAAEARKVEAVTATVVERWRMVAAIAEQYLIDSAINDLSLPELDLDVPSFEAAGLASQVAANQLRAATARLASEQAELGRARADSLARLRQLLGLPDRATLNCKSMNSDWLKQPQGTTAELLERPDLALVTARFEVADAQFRQAVAEQYPSFQIGPNVSLRGDPLRAMGMLRIPIAMHGLAKAARERRQAARDDLEGAFLRARREATTGDTQLAAATALLDATAASLQASTSAFAAARASIEVEVDAFEHFAGTAQRVARDTMEHRKAALAHARAAVFRASAYGWPRQIKNPTTASPEAIR